MRSRHEALRLQLNSLQNDMRMKDERIEQLTREIQHLVRVVALEISVSVIFVGRKMQRCRAKRFAISATPR